MDANLLDTLGPLAFVVIALAIVGAGVAGVIRRLGSSSAPDAAALRPLPAPVCSDVGVVLPDVQAPACAVASDAVDTIRDGERRPWRSVSVADVTFDDAPGPD